LLALPHVAAAVGRLGPPVQAAWEADSEIVPADGVAAHAEEQRRAAPAARARALGALRRRMKIMMISSLPLLISR
jgi:hypothetical protein